MVLPYVTVEHFHWSKWVSIVAGLEAIFTPSFFIYIVAVYINALLNRSNKIAKIFQSLIDYFFL